MFIPTENKIQYLLGWQVYADRSNSHSHYSADDWLLKRVDYDEDVVHSAAVYVDHRHIYVYFWFIN